MQPLRDGDQQLVHVSKNLPPSKYILICEQQHLEKGKQLKEDITLLTPCKKVEIIEIPNLKNPWDFKKFTNH